MSRLEEVAALAGVSKATVSRVINNSETVSASSRQKVLDAMRQLKFNAHELKRSNERTMMIGLILPLTTSSFSVDILAGAEQKAFEMEYMILLGNSKETEKERQLTIQMLNRDVEGVLILSTSVREDNEHIMLLEKSGLPFVLVDQRIERVATNLVRGDNILGGITLMNHLFELGHTRIACVSPSSHSTYRDRSRGYQISLMEKGIPFEEGLYVMLQKHEQLEEQLQRLFAQQPAPTALYVTDPTVLGPLVAVTRKLGVRIPEDVSVVVFDEAYTQLPREYVNFFTSYNQSGKMMGSLAVEVLFQQLRDHSAAPQEIVLPGALFVGKSTRRAE